MAKVTRQTVRGALLGFVVTVNDLLRGRDSPADVPQLNAAEITGAVMDRTKGLDDRLDVATDEEMLDRAMEFILEWASGSHGIPIVLPNEQELTLSSVEKALINCALAPCDMDMTPRQFLRQPKTLEFLKEILVVFAKACIDPELEAADDAETEAEAERFCWEEAAGIILDDSEMLRMYLQSTGAQKDRASFLVLVRKALVNLDEVLTRDSLKDVLAHAEHEVAMKSERSQRPLSRGGTA